MAQTTRPSNSMRRGFQYFISVPFLFLGLSPLGLIVTDLFAWSNMQSWVETPARIERVVLVTGPSSNSRTGKFEAKYAYEWMGKYYHGDQVSLHISLEIGSYNSRLREELAEYLDRGEPFRCYVNPANPEQAVLYRDLSLDVLGFNLLFGLILESVGFGIICIVVYRGRRARETAALQQQYPDEPWHWKKEWHEGVLHYHVKKKVLILLITSLIWIWFTLLPAWDVLGELWQGNMIALVGLLFPLVGASLIAATVYMFLKWRRFGDVTFVLSPVPGLVGDELRGHIRIPTDTIMDNDVTARLECVRQVTTGAGKQRKLHKFVLWQENALIPKSALIQESRATAIPIAFQIPEALPQADDSNSDDQIIWQLRARASLRWINFSVDFDVPVF